MRMNSFMYVFLKICIRVSWNWIFTFEPPHVKTNKVAVRPAKMQISQGICPVWSESSLCVLWVAKDPSFLQADSEDSDQTGRIPRLIWVFAGHTCHLVGFVVRRLISIVYSIILKSTHGYLCEVLRTYSSAFIKWVLSTYSSSFQAISTQYLLEYWSSVLASCLLMTRDGVLLNSIRRNCHGVTIYRNGPKRTKENTETDFEEYRRARHGWAGTYFVATYTRT